MSALDMEQTLARLYTDSRFRQLFLRDPGAAMQALDLTEQEKSDLARIDRAGLVMAAASYRHKRERRSRRLYSTWGHLARLTRAALKRVLARP